MENSSKEKTNYLDKLKNIPLNKKMQYLIICVIVICIVVILISAAVDRAPPTLTSNNSELLFETEERLAEILAGINGAGDVRVMINYDSKGEIIPAYTKNTQQSSTLDDNRKNQNESTNEQIVTLQSGNETNALIVKEKSPEVLGVIVITEGAGNIGVKFELLRAVRTILAVEDNKIEIFEMKKE